MLAHSSMPPEGDVDIICSFKVFGPFASQNHEVGLLSRSFISVVQSATRFAVYSDYAAACDWSWISTVEHLVSRNPLLVIFFLWPRAMKRRQRRPATRAGTALESGEDAKLVCTCWECYSDRSVRVFKSNRTSTVRGWLVGTGGVV